MTDKLLFKKKKKKNFDCVCKFLEVELYSFLDNLEGRVLIIGLTIYLSLYFDKEFYLVMVEITSIFW